MTETIGHRLQERLDVEFELLGLHRDSIESVLQGPKYSEEFFKMARKSAEKFVRRLRAQNMEPWEINGVITTFVHVFLDQAREVYKKIQTPYTNLVAQPSSNGQNTDCTEFAHQLPNLFPHVVFFLEFAAFVQDELRRIDPNLNILPEYFGNHELAPRTQLDEPSRIRLGITNAGSNPSRQASKTRGALDPAKSQNQRSWEIQVHPEDYI